MLNKQQRLNLRSYAQSLPDTVFVGKLGITPNVIAQVNDNLYCHEIVKVKVQQNSANDARELATAISEQCQCEVVTVIGSKIVLYKATDKPTNSDNKAVRNALSSK